MTKHARDRAVVLGAGMAGLLAARVLSETYQEVLVIDRDRLGGMEQRRGVPHGRHAHALLAKGQQILNELFPGLDTELTSAGIPAGDIAGNLRWYFNGRRLQPFHTGLVSVSATRPELESHVRARVAALPQVTIMDGCVIRGLTASADRSRVTGVEVVDESGTDTPARLEADLVVDVTGRGSRTPAWLEEFGYERPAEDRFKIDLAYTTRHFKLKEDPYGTDLSINPVASPSNPRGAFFPRLADGSSQLSLTGILGDHPPTDDEGFLAFAKSLAAPEIYRAVREAEPLDEPVTFRFPASVRRRYERLRRFPGGFLVMGDGVCSFNPVYGQGMTVAALEAVALRDHLRDAPVPDALRFFRRISTVIDVPWDIAAGADLNFPGVEGPRTMKVKVANAYMARLHAAAAVDGAVTGAFFRVAGLVDPPQALLRPSLALRVMRNSSAKPSAPSGAAA
ncbi:MULTISPECIES: NAD(P)/FAD-dependent oxidoreductase [Streptomyces]|uniref:FAD-dependent oxidoreductase n=1 Tax=Streptomyces TaxID=1883 RepID=UPI0004C891B5|nr:MULTISPECIES: NAD(P)-binding protein [Streptomyces]MDX2918413.1 NAD(P)-binding protein [Streptomyces sp. NE06-03C]MDX3606494.1 NAD(P)-binding protein [Streptomyces sp. FL06-04B]MDX3739533.1 NAD(P)-binding protein [Streptomyces sp. ID01-15D]